MPNATGLRWTFLLTALSITVLAIIYPTAGVETTEVKQNKSSQPKVATKENVENSRQKIAHDEVLDETDDPVDDPFLPRGWEQPAVVIAPVIAPVSIAAVAALPVSIGPPPLPYRFLGKMNDGEDLVIYLGRGEQTIVARLGETLEGSYKVLKIVDQGMEFEYLPTGEKQNLSFE